MTKDHSLVQELVDQGLLDKSEMESHPDKNVILRSMGVKPTVDVDVLGAGEPSADELRKGFQDVCEASVEPDGMRFDAESVHVESGVARHPQDDMPDHIDK